MKGIIIYEDYRGMEVVEAIKLGEVDYTCKSASSDDGWLCELSGIRMTSTQAYCNKEDTYDFETGALIALMRMCGVDKVVRACNEAFSEDTFKTYATKYERELNELKEEIKRLKGESENRWKKYQRNIQKKQDRINELEIYNNQMEKLEEENEKLKNESMNRLKDKLNLKKEYVALKAENEKLKLDCEKLQHGYNDMINTTTAQWFPSGKYFIKCSNCGYEIFNFNRIATPRKCPKCDKLMYEVIRRIKNDR